MKYIYKFTKDFEIALDWVLRSQSHYNVTFRFTIESYTGVRKGLWMSPSQSLAYLRTAGVDFRFKNLTMRICA